MQPLKGNTKKKEARSDNATLNVMHRELKMKIVWRLKQRRSCKHRGKKRTTKDEKQKGYVPHTRVCSLGYTKTLGYPMRNT